MTTTTKRSLPDIPAEQLAVVNWEPIGDNSSEHYATVGQYPNASKFSEHETFILFTKPTDSRLKFFIINGLASHFGRS